MIFIYYIYTNVWYCRFLISGYSVYGSSSIRNFLIQGFKPWSKCHPIQIFESLCSEIHPNRYHGTLYFVSHMETFGNKKIKKNSCTVYESILDSLYMIRLFYLYIFIPCVINSRRIGLSSYSIHLWLLIDDYCIS